MGVNEASTAYAVANLGPNYTELYPTFTVSLLTMDEMEWIGIHTAIVICTDFSVRVRTDLYSRTHLSSERRRCNACRRAKRWDILLYVTFSHRTRKA